MSRHEIEASIFGLKSKAAVKAGRMYFDLVLQAQNRAGVYLMHKFGKREMQSRHYGRGRAALQVQHIHVNTIIWRGKAMGIVNLENHCCLFS